jgi:hypothetical protein
LLADEPDYLASGEPRPVPGAWDGAQAFWYDLLAEPVDAA